RQHDSPHAQPDRPAASRAHQSAAFVEAAGAGVPRGPPQEARRGCRPRRPGRGRAGCVADARRRIARTGDRRRPRARSCCGRRGSWRGAPLSGPPENKNPAGRIAWRFATGQHLDGRRRSDSTFFARGTRADPHYWGRGGESKWALLPGWKRAGLRWALVLVPLALRYRPVYAEWGMALVLGPLAGWQALRAVRAWLAHRHFRDSYRPLHTALAPVLDIPDATT